MNKDILNAANNYATHEYQIDESITITMRRRGFEDGAIWMRDELINKANNWIDNHISLDRYWESDNRSVEFNKEKFINDFKEALKIC